MHPKLNISKVMKRILLIGIVVLVAVTGFAQNTTKVKTLKEQQQVLNLTSKLNLLKIEYEKEKASYNDLNVKVASVNATANAVTTAFTTSDAKSTVSDAKSTIKTLKETEETNKELAKAQKKLGRMEKQIAKLQARIDELNKRVEFVDQ